MIFKGSFCNIAEIAGIQWTDQRTLASRTLERIRTITVVIELSRIGDEVAVVAIVGEAVIVVVIVAGIAATVAIRVHLLAIRNVRAIVDVILERNTRRCQLVT